MSGIMNFDINEALKLYLSDPAAIPTTEADNALQDCENDPESLTPALVNSVLNPIIESIAANGESLLAQANFDSLQFLLKFSSFLPSAIISKLFDVLISGLSVEADAMHHDLESDEQEAIHQHKVLLEAYAFLLQWTISAVETKALEKSSTTAPVRARGGKAAKTKAKEKDGVWDSTKQLQQALETMCKVLKLKIGKAFVTTPERDTFVGLFTRPVYLIFENEQRVKVTAIRMHAYKVLCIAVKHHGHAFGAQTSIIQNLTYFEHLSEPMAEFLHILAEQFDYAQLTDEVLRELSTKEYDSNDTRGPKSVASFIVKLSELAPRLVLKQITLLAKQLDSEVYSLRCAILEVCGNLITDMSNQEERPDNYKSQINGFFDILEERFLDINPYARSKAIQVYMKLCDLEQKFPKRRQAAAALAARSLEDKSSNVRRNAIKLLAKLVTTHPFSLMHGGLLSYTEWNERLEACDAELNALKPPVGSPGLAEKKQQRGIDEQLLDEVTQMEEDKPEEEPEMTTEQIEEAAQKAQEEAATSEMMNRLQLTRKYYGEAIRFIQVLHDANPVICQLLSAKNKSEVIEAMDYFVIADAYKIEPARMGIRKMLRLIWTKGNSDEGKGVQTHLVDCYKGLFFDAPENFGENETANYIARNMISLTFGATPAELTSLEQLLSMMMEQGHVSPLVVSKLWQVYSVDREISRNQRRGAIAVLGMLGLADSSILTSETESMLNIGLGPLGQADLALARYTCIALKRLHPTGKQVKGKTVMHPRLPSDHHIFARLAAMCELVSDSKDWMGMAEQAVGAIYALAKHPDGICTEILQRKTKYVFTTKRPKTPNDSEMDVTPPPEEPQRSQSNASALSQLLFLVGHIAIKQIVHLELTELEFKRRKQEKEKEKPEKSKKEEPTGDAELDLIGGTNEDDFVEFMNNVRERELLYAPNALLSNFGPLVAEICSNNTAYKNRDLQAAATLCMAKLMCVSSEYCESQLPLLITILERSEDAITRNNVVISLGDMAVCFNHLIDENTDFLYRRLNDKDASVKRTCLMTLTFLILAGQVKVKGQLGEMAKCLEDSDKRIADLSRMFFTELATKDNAVYNQFVDMFSMLSADRELAEDEFRRIVRFLAGFIEKDKHAKQLAAKLAARLPRCRDERQWNDVAFALGLLQHKDESITKTLQEGYQVVQAVPAAPAAPTVKAEA